MPGRGRASEEASSLTGYEARRRRCSARARLQAVDTPDPRVSCQSTDLDDGGSHRDR